MRTPDRRLLLGLTLVLCVALLGRWAMQSDDSARAPPRTGDAAAIQDPSDQAQPPTIAGIGADAFTNESASAFGTLRGRVIDAVTREPVHEFEVQVHSTGARKLGDAVAGARGFHTRDGRFEWEHLVPGRWTVTASARGYQRFELMGLQISRNAATPEVLLPLRPGHTLRGRVYDELSGVGIAAASIGFREPDVGRTDTRGLARPTTSGKDGSFVLEGVPPGRITLDVSARDYADRELGAVVGDDTPPLQIGLSEGGSIAGQLTAADGMTPAMGNVYLARHDEQSAGGGPTGKGGQFAFPHLAPGRYQLRGYAHDIAVIKEIVLASNQHIGGVMLALHEGRSIRGVVTGLRPEDLQRAYVALYREGDGGGASHANSGVDERGAYALRGVQPGRVRIVVNADRRHLSRTVDVSADADIRVDLDFPPGSRLYGRVTRAGKPLPGVSVNTQPLAPQRVYVHGTAITSKDGTYSIKDLAPGDYAVSADGYRSRPARIAGDTSFDIDVPPLGQLSGHVLQENSEAPIVGADVQVWPAEQGSPRIRLQRQSDHLGQFALVGLEPGDFMLTVYKPEYELFRQRISYASPVAGMTIRLRHDRGVEIRVRGAGGLALRQVYLIEATADGEDNVLQFQLDEQGVGYLPGGLAGGTLSFYASGYASAVVRDWNGQRLDLQLARQDAQ